MSSGMDNREGVHYALPVLDIEYLPEMKYTAQPQHQKKKKGRQLEDEQLTYMMSAFYAKILVIIGIAFSITRSITKKGNYQHDIYYIYLYTGSNLFLLYMYYIHSRAKSLMYEINNCLYKGSIELAETYKKKLYVRYGSFYFRMGVVGFGVGSLIYSTLKFGQYFEFSSEPNCTNISRALKPGTRIAYLLLQMLFIFSFSNFLAVQKSQLIAKFGLMHLIATNISDWFQVLVEQTVHDLVDSVYSRHRHAHTSNYSYALVPEETELLEIQLEEKEREKQCLKIDIIGPILVRLDPHLASCAVEYNLLCTMILLLMWKNNTQDKEKASRDLSTEISRQSGSNVIYGRSQSQFSVDCAQTQRGLFSGILLLAVTIISLILFFELIVYDDTKDLALLQQSSWELVLFLTSTVAALLGFIKVKDLEINKTNKQELSLEHLLLLITQCGVFIYFIFQVIAGCLMGPMGTGGIVRIVTPLLAVIESCSQTTFILDCWRRRCATEVENTRKPGRQLITFLLIVNMALWLVNRVKNNRSAFHPNQMNFFGILAWNIITHVSMPLVVSYRFQATVCFYEIWKHVYKRSMKHNVSENLKQENQS